MVVIVRITYVPTLDFTSGLARLFASIVSTTIIPSQKSWKSFIGESSITIVQAIWMLSSSYVCIVLFPISSTESYASSR